MNLPRIGYVPYSPSLERPGDRRRFVYYARKRNLPFEIASPDKDYDLVVLSECADISVWSRYDRGHIVYDLIDSYLAIPRNDLKGLLRGTAKFLSRQSRYLQVDHWAAIADLCRRSSAVVCSTEEQKRDISVFNTNTHIVLDIHSPVVSRAKESYSAGRPFRLVWEGLPHTLYSLVGIRDVLEEIRREIPLELHIITDPVYFRYLGRYGQRQTLTSVRKIFPWAVLHEWREDTLADTVCSCDLAVIPLCLDDPFAAGKPENKLLLFWRLAMPAVVSATPAYRRAMASCGADLACVTGQEWYAALKGLIMSEEKRREAGVKGKWLADQSYGEECLLGRWDSVFASIGFNFAPPQR